MSFPVLVVGGAGYIGSHACKALSSAGFEPICLDNFSSGHAEFVRWGPCFEGDMGDCELLDEIFARFRIAAVMHFAALSVVGDSVAEPRCYYSNNVVSTIKLLDAMLSHDVRRLIFSSTCATYGLPNEVPITEAHPQHPINPYGRTKLIVENVLEDYAEAYGLRSISLRYFNAAGADPDGEIGEDHNPETHLIPIVLDAALGRRGGVTIYGTDYSTADGSCVRDYIHVSDLADAHVRALRALFEPPYRSAYNLGNGRGFSVKEVVAACERVTSRQIKVTEGSKRPGDPPVLVGDADLAKKDLGWSPHYTALDQIIATAWQWHKLRFS